MRKLAPVTEQFQAFVEEMEESFWGDLQGKTKVLWKRFWETDSMRARDRYLGVGWYERWEEPERDYRNGFYERDFVDGLPRRHGGIPRIDLEGHGGRGLGVF